MGNKITCKQSAKVLANVVKSILFFLLLFVLIPKSYAQVGIGVNPPDPSAMLHVQDTAKGLLIPRMTAAQKNAIINPANGLLIYQLDELAQGFWYYNGSQWTSLSAASNGGLHTVVFSDSVTNAQAIAQIATQFGPNTQEIRINDCINLTSIDLSMVTNLVDVFINNNSSLQTVNLSNLQRVEGGFYVNGCPSLTTLNIPVLKKIGRSQDGGYGFFMLNSGMTNLALPMVSIITGSLGITFNPNLQSVSFPAFEHNTGTDMSIGYNPVLTNISFPVLKTEEKIFTIQNNHSLPSLNFPSLTSIYSLYVANQGSLTTVSLPALTTVTRDISLTKDTGFTSLSVPLLTSAAGLGVTYCNEILSLSCPSLVTLGNCSFTNNNNLSSISLNSVTAADYLYIRDCNSISSLAFPSLVTLGTCYLVNNTSLSSISLNNLTALSSSGNFNGNVLPSSQINALLNKIVSINPPIVNKSFDFRQSVAAPPTGQGLVDKATLIARPNSVATD